MLKKEKKMWHFKVGGKTNNVKRIYNSYNPENTEMYHRLLILC